MLEAVKANTRQIPSRWPDAGYRSEEMAKLVNGYQKPDWSLRA
jgi:hypothetical protein